MAFDAAVIGGGIVGTAIARELGRRGARVVLLERESDIGEGTSKANSAIIHSGFDAPVDSLEAELLARARTLWNSILATNPIPSVSTGAIMLALTETDSARLESVVAQAAHNGVGVERRSAARVRDRLPMASPQVRDAVWIAAERVVDPFQAVRAFAEAALSAGAVLRTQAQVVGIRLADSGVALELANGDVVEARFVVNAAGLWADEVARMIGEDTLTITPRKGQFLVSETTLGIDTILLPVPTARTKGILIAPIAFGGILLGPTATDQADKSDRSTTEEGLRTVVDGAARLAPAVRELSSVRQFAGLRAVHHSGRYQIYRSPCDGRVLHVAGIRSTGVSAAPAIAEYVADRLAEAGLAIGEPRAAVTVPPLTFAVGERDDPELACLCRNVTVGEVRAALRRPPLPQTLDAVKRRTGAMLGECQGNLCATRLMELIAAETGESFVSVRKAGPGSEVAVSADAAPRPAPARLPDVGGPLDAEVEVLVVGAGHSGRRCLDALAAAGLEVVGVDWIDVRAPRVWGRATAIALDRADGAGWEVTLACAGGPTAVRARAVVLATGTIEQPREAALIPGSRPVGVATPTLAVALAARGLVIGRRPLVWIDGPASERAALDLRAAGADVALRGPGAGDRRIVGVDGWPRVASVLIERLDGGVDTQTCDALVYTHGLWPNTSVLKGMAASPAVGRPIAVDASGRTPLEDVYAVGTCVLPDPDHGTCDAQAETVARTVVRDRAASRPWPTLRPLDHRVASAVADCVLVPSLAAAPPEGGQAFALAGRSPCRVTVRAGAGAGPTASRRLGPREVWPLTPWHGGALFDVAVADPAAGGGARRAAGR